MQRWIIAVLLLISFKTHAQEEQIEMEEALETMVAADETAADKITESSNSITSGKININKTDEKDLFALGFLTPEQIKQLLLYRKQLGDFISLYELQAIPYWDEQTVRKAIPYMTITTAMDIMPDMKQRFKEGAHTLVYRTGGSKSGFGINGAAQYNSYSDQATGYKQLIKYQYQFRTLLQWGITLEKDAGEKSIADYLGYYLYLRKRGIIKSLVIGNYVVNIGQGLMEWQGYAFGQSCNIVGAMRQGDVFKPHTGSDENRFHKGIAITLEKGKWQCSIFGGKEKIDANIISDSTRVVKQTVSSFLTSGLHRTASEIIDKDALDEIVMGSRLSFEHHNVQVGINALHYHFDIPIEKRWLPYNYYAPRGKSFSNASVDLKANILQSYTFGEFAINHTHGRAGLLGIMKSLDPRLDMSIIFRSINKSYFAFQPNALIRNGNSNNETGLFTCLNFQWDSRHRIEGYHDQYINTWPVYYNDGIRRGKIDHVQMIWKPNKKTELSLRYSHDAETKNMRHVDDKSNRLNWMHTEKIRVHISFMPHQDLIIRQRIEWSRFKNEDGQKQQGSLYYIEMIYKPLMKPYSLSVRSTLYQTDGYDSRIYAYERDLSSYFSIPAYFNAGMSNYLLANVKINKRIQGQLKYIFSKSAGDGMVWGNTSFGNLLKKEWRMQLICEW